METVSKNTHELRRGDVILNHGMLLEIDAPGRVSTVHDMDEFGPCVVWPARCVNVDTLDDSWLVNRLHQAGWHADGTWSAERANRWPIQGNRLATWVVVVA